MNLRRGWWILGIVAIAALLAAGPVVAGEGYFSNADGNLTSSDLVTYTSYGWGGPAGDSPRTGGACDTGVMGYMEYLYMGAHRQGLDVALVGNPNAANADFRVADAQYGRDSGFRVGLGYQCSSCWDFSWNYTYFSTEGALALQATAADPVSTTQFLRAGVFGAQAGDFAFRSLLVSHVNDIEFGRWFNFDSGAAFRLFGGFRWAIIDQSLAQAYVVPDGAGGTLAGASLSTINMDAYGIRLGSEGRWNLPRGFSVFGKGAVSILSGHFDNSVAEIRAFSNPNFAAGNNSTIFRDNTTQAVPVLEAAVGVAWTYDHLEVSLGYELDCWFNMADRNTLGVPPVSNDLLLDGLFVRAAFTR